MSTKTKHMPEKHKYYDAAYRAHSGTSFSPEKRAVAECEYYDAVCAEFISSGKEWAIEKFSRLFSKLLAARSRCVSTMIAGSANFPVARMQKYNRWERNASDAMLAFVEKVRRPAREKRTELDYGIKEKEYEMGGARVLQNVQDNRLQIFFGGKPEPEMLTKLKSNGYKWSPRNLAWQRQLTPNAIASLSYVFAEHQSNSEK